MLSYQCKYRTPSKHSTLTQLYDGYDDQSPLLGTYSDEPSADAGDIMATTNVLFVSWSAPNEALFRLTWSAVDSGLASFNASAEQQTLNCTQNSFVRLGTHEIVNITSPGYPDKYPENQLCKWTLSTVPGYHVAVYFNTIDLEDTVNCESDSVTVAASTNIAGPFGPPSTRFCTAKSNNSIHTKIHGTPFLQINFKSDYYISRQGFSAVARVMCGGQLSGPSGSLTMNMTLADSTFIGQSCDWLIKVREGRTIRFHFRSLRLDRTDASHCETFLLLRNGHTDTSPYLGNGQYCGALAPEEPLQTSANVAFVQFVKGRQTRLDDFAVDYEEVSTECGGTLALNEPTTGGGGNTSLIVQSPNYPNIPNAFSECVWTVMAPHGQVLRIDFVDQFELLASPGCTQELVELRDGSTQRSPLIGTFCAQMPSTQHTATNVVRMRYFTQTKLPKNGFRARISLDSCGGSYREASGYVQSPGFPGEGAMPANAVCDYRIHSLPGTTLNITFLNFGMYSELHDYDRGDGDCTGHDHVAVYYVLPPSGDNNNSTDDGGDSDAAPQPTLSLIGQYCGVELPDTILSQTNEVLVRLVTKQPSPHSPGFRLFYNTSIDRCGGDIRAEAGFIMSPGYPVGRANRQFCEWRITVPKGRRVSVGIMDFDMVSMTSAVMAFGQRLNFYNDFTYASRIRTLTGSEQPGVIHSTDNRMLINMWSRSNVGHRGFKLNFTSADVSACAGELGAGQSGVIESPANLTTFSCTYERVSSSSSTARNTIGSTLSLQISTVETTPNTPMSTVPCRPGLSLPLRVVHAGHELFAVRRSCANGTDTVSKTVSTPFADAAVIARQNAWLRSYRIEYHVYECGGVIAGTDAYTVRPPNVTTTTTVRAEEELHCAWQFSALPSVRIKVTMTFAELDCERDFVNVFNGPYPNSPLVDRVCGVAETQRSFTDDISGEQLLVEFHTTRYRPNATRFTIQIETNYALCGGLLTAPNFGFVSPRNNSAAAAQLQYPNNVLCQWELRARRGYHVGLAFRNRFFVEQSANCTKDSVMLLDTSTKPRLLANLCGRAAPGVYNTTGRTMSVVMRTDAQTTGDGFDAVWSENCGGVFEVLADAEPQDVYSPNYPGTYDRNMFCNYTLVGPSDQYINVAFEHFELEDSTRGCVYDNLTVYRTPDWWMSGASELVGTYCTEGSLRHLRYKNSIQLIFRTDQWLERRGFHFRYSLDRCGGTIANTTMVRSPPGVDTAAAADPSEWSYMPEMKCVWNITAPDNQKIVVRFERLELEPSDYCSQDYVELYEGASMVAEQRKASLCGNLTRHAPVVNLNSNRAVLRFQSDMSFSAGGFEALVMFVPRCDKTIELTEAAPQYELNQVFAEYAPNMDCHFKVTAPDGWNIRMDFQEFHVAPCADTSSANGTAATTTAKPIGADCRCDYVQVRDGAGEFAEPIGVNRCGYDVPASVHSSQGAMWVRFVSGELCE